MCVCVVSLFPLSRFIKYIVILLETMFLCYFVVVFSLLLSPSFSPSFSVHAINTTGSGLGFLAVDGVFILGGFYCYCVVLFSTTLPPSPPLVITHDLSPPSLSLFFCTHALPLLLSLLSCLCCFGLIR